MAGFAQPPAALVVGLAADTAAGITCVAIELESKTLVCRTTCQSNLAWDALTSWPDAAAELHVAATSCLNTAKRDWEHVQAVCACAPSAANEYGAADLKAALLPLLPQHAALAVNSCAAAVLSSVTGGQLHGVVLLAGKTTAAHAILNGGRVNARASGWGHAFLDGGCAFDLGSRALAAVSKARDGRGADTILSDAVLQHLKIQKEDQLIRWACAHDIDKRVSEVSEIAQLVIDVAARGDAVADTILKHGVGELFRSAKTVVARTKLDQTRQPYKLVLAGTLLEEGSLYTQYLLDALKESLPTADICFATVEAATGAAWIARNLARERPHGAAAAQQSGGASGGADTSGGAGPSASGAGGGAAATAPGTATAPVEDN